MIGALTNHLWQSTLFVVAAALVAAALHKNGADVRHRIWLVASLKFLVPFSLLVSLGGMLPRPAPAVATGASAPDLSVAVDRIQYTLSKSTDDVATFSGQSIAPGSLSIAQDWLNLSAERAPSSFDQRHLVTAEVQYTTGVGVSGGTLVDGFWGTLFKDWTITSQLSRGSGLPFTPVSFSVVSGTGIVGVRPSLTGASTTPAPGSYANAAAYAAPAPGTWGDAGRNSIRGPAQFSLDATVARVFRLRGRMNLEWRVAATNVLNRVTFSTIDTIVTSPQFGQPTAANAMRRLQITMRLRF